MNVQSIVKGSDLNALLQLTPMDLDIAARGLDMLRVPISCLLEVRETHAELLSRQRGYCLGWLRCCGLDCSSLGDSWLKVPVVATADDGSHGTILQSIRDASSGHCSVLCVTCEDKDASILWLNSSGGLLARWLDLFKAAEARWSILDADLPALVILKFYRLVFDRCIPGNMKRGWLLYPSDAADE